MTGEHRHEFERIYGALPQSVEWSDRHGRYILKIHAAELTGNKTPAERINLIYQGYLWGLCRDK